MEYREVEEGVLEIAHYVTGREPGSMLPGHCFRGWEDLDWDDFLMEVEYSFCVPIMDGAAEKLREGTLAGFAVYLHELLE